MKLLKFKWRKVRTIPGGWGVNNFRNDGITHDQYEVDVVFENGQVYTFKDIRPRYMDKFDLVNLENIARATLRGVI
jgi:hypothetical protein